MTTIQIFYICPVCFNASEIAIECHEHMMIECRIDYEDADSFKPIYDSEGRLKTRAPRWFFEAAGRRWIIDNS